GPSFHPLGRERTSPIARQATSAPGDGGATSLSACAPLHLSPTRLARPTSLKAVGIPAVAIRGAAHVSLTHNRTRGLLARAPSIWLDPVLRAGLRPVLRAPTCDLRGRGSALGGTD